MSFLIAHYPYFAGGVMLVCLLALLAIRLFVRRYNRKHIYNIKKSYQLLDKLSAFTGEFAQAQIIKYLKQINPYVFEELLLSTYERHGYRIRRNYSYSGDGGCDGTVWSKDGKKILIQAKRYKHGIKPEHVCAFAYLCGKESATGFFVHTGSTPDFVRVTLRETPQVKIVSGSQLAELIQTAAKKN